MSIINRFLIKPIVKGIVSDIIRSFAQPPFVIDSNFLLLENGFKLLLEDGSKILLEGEPNFLLLENGFKLLLEDGFGMALEI